MINTILSLFTCFNCLTHVWWLAGRRVTLQTRYFLRMVPQCVTSTFSPAHKPHNQTAITKHTHTGTHTNTHSPTQEHILTSKHTHKYTYTHRQSQTQKDTENAEKHNYSHTHTQTVTETECQTFDFFGEFDSVGVCEWPRLLVNIVNVQNFTHELNYWLCFVESCGRNCKTEESENWSNVATNVRKEDISWEIKLIRWFQ